jgi:hypothetical protein
MGLSTKVSDWEGGVVAESEECDKEDKFCTILRQVVTTTGVFNPI